MRTSPTIAVVGAGYGGLAAVGRLLQLLPGAQVVLVEPGLLHVERARLHRALRGEPVAWRLDEVLPKGVRWVRARALEVGANFVRTARQRIRADHVIVAAGARPRPAPAGAFSAWELDGMRRIRRALGSGRQVAVIGAGLTGVEVACAIASRLQRQGAVRLRDRGPSLLPGLPPAVRETVEKALERLGIDVELEVDEPPPPNVIAVAATGADPAPIPGEGAVRVGDADPANRLRCAQVARLQGQRAAAEVARACGVEAPLPGVEMLGQVIDLGRAGATGWIGAAGLKLPLPAAAAAVGLEAVAVRHRAFLRTLPFLGGGRGIADLLARRVAPGHPGAAAPNTAVGAVSER